MDSQNNRLTERKIVGWIKRLNERNKGLCSQGDLVVLNSMILNPVTEIGMKVLDYSNKI